jgi:SSS family solute:Na+ symporter
VKLLAIDYVIVSIYLIGTIIVGVYYERYIHSSGDYFLAGKLLPFWAIGLSIVGTDIGAVDFVGLTGQAYRYGIVVGNFDWIGSVPAMILAGLVFIPYYWRAGVYTIPEYLGKRYNIYVRAISAIIWLVFIAFSLGVMLWATGLLLKAMLGWPIMLSILLTVAVVGIYTITGGLSAVVMTDVIQVVIMVVGAIAILILGFWELGGWTPMVDKITAMGSAYSNHFNLVISPQVNTPYPWTGILFGLTLVLAPAYFIGNQVIIQRSLGARDEWNAKASMLFGAFIKILIPILVVIPGLIALALQPGIENPDEVYAVLIKKLLPPGLMGLVFAAFLAALMSTVSAIINSVATVWTKDVYEVFIQRGADDRRSLMMGRVVTGLILLIAVISSPLSSQFPGVYVYVQTINSFVQGPIFAVLLLGMFWKRATQWGGLAGMVGGILLSGVMFYFRNDLFTIEQPFLYISWWSFLGSIIICVLVSLLTIREPLEKLRGLVFRMVFDDIELQNAIHQTIQSGDNKNAEL